MPPRYFSDSLHARHSGGALRRGTFLCIRSPYPGTPCQFHRLVKGKAPTVPIPTDQFLCTDLLSVFYLDVGDQFGSVTAAAESRASFFPSARSS